MIMQRSPDAQRERFNTEEFACVFLLEYCLTSKLIQRLLISFINISLSFILLSFGLLLVAENSWQFSQLVFIIVSQNIFSLETKSKQAVLSSFGVARVVLLFQEQTDT